MNSKQKSLRGSLMLLLTAMIWGFAFVAQRVGGENAGQFLFATIRFMIGGLTLTPIIIISKKSITRNEIIGGLVCGSILAVANTLQQHGIALTDVGKAGFITTLYVVLVPIFSLFIGKKPTKKIWISVILSAIGLFLLCINSTFVLNKGDILVFICAFVFTGHIFAIDHFSPIADGMVVSCIQFFVASFISSIGVLIFERPVSIDLSKCWIPLLYSGVLSCGVAYTLQVIFQKDVEATKASLILCLESVFSVIGGWLLLGQSLTIKELLGCLVMLIAIVLAQI